MVYFFNSTYMYLIKISNVHHCISLHCMLNITKLKLKNGKKSKSGANLKKFQVTLFYLFAIEGFNIVIKISSLVLHV